MDKKVDLNFRTVLSFSIGLIFLLLAFAFKKIFFSLAYPIVIINTFFILNMVLFALFISFSVIIKFKNFDSNNKKRDIVFALFIVIIFVLINMMGPYLASKPITNKYKDLALIFSEYSNNANCETYGEIKNSKYYEYIATKRYFDYNNNENMAKFYIKYDYDKIDIVRATLNVNPDVFSDILLGGEVNSFFNNFDVNIDSNKIRQAFDKRFESAINDNDYNIKYQVVEEYEDDNLVAIKLIVTLKNPKIKR